MTMKDLKNKTMTDIIDEKNQRRRDIAEKYKQGIPPWGMDEKIKEIANFSNNVMTAKAKLTEEGQPYFECRFFDGVIKRQDVIRSLDKENVAYYPKYIQNDDDKLSEDVLVCLNAKKRNEATEMLVDSFKEKYKIFTIRNDDHSEMWVYSEGIYIPDGKTYIQEFCRQILGDSYTVQLKNLVTEKIQADTFINQDKFFVNENKNLIPVNNGVFNIKTKELEKFSDKYRFFNKIQVDYDPDNKNSTFHEFFSSILRNANDVLIIQELFGYCLYRDFPIHKCFMLNGNGRNGKGKTLELLKIFVNPENCTDLTMKDMEEDNFTINRLHNKLVNLSGDIDGGFISQSGQFKKLTGGDLVTAKRKFKTDITFTNHAKMIFACNRLPNFADDSHGFWERWALLDFPYTFLKESDYIGKSEDEIRQNKYKKANPDILNELLSEENKPALLNWALKGLYRLLENGHFSESTTREDVQKEWKRKSSPMFNFVEKICEIDYEAKTAISDFKAEYMKFCMKAGVKPESTKAYDIILQNEFGIFKSKNMDGWYYQAVKVKTLSYPEKQVMTNMTFMT